MRPLEHNFNPESGEMKSHYSALTLHRKCPQAWYYRYGLDLERSEDTTSPERDLGIWWSAIRAIEAINRGIQRGSLIFPPKTIRVIDNITIDPEKATPKDIRPAAEFWWRKQSGEAREAWEEKLGVRDFPDHLEEMFSRWMDYTVEERQSENPIGAEVFWKRPLPRPKQDAQWSLADLDNIPQLNLIGYIDEIYIDTDKNDMLIVRDNKTSKTVESGTSDIDTMDAQLPLYVWGIIPQLNRNGLKSPRGVSYDRTRSKAPTEPKLTASGALSKSVSDYTLQTYLRWVSKDNREEQVALAIENENLGEADVKEILSILDKPGRVWGKPGDYYKSGKRAGEPKFGIYLPDDEEIERLRSNAVTSKWNQRTLDPVNANVIRAHLRASVDTAMDIWQTQMRANMTGEAARNLSRMGCQMCDFRSLCKAQMIGGSSGTYDLAEHGLRKKQR